MRGMLQIFAMVAAVALFCGVNAEANNRGQLAVDSQANTSVSATFENSQAQTLKTDGPIIASPAPAAAAAPAVMGELGNGSQTMVSAPAVVCENGICRVVNGVSQCGGGNCSPANCQSGNCGSYSSGDGEGRGGPIRRALRAVKRVAGRAARVGRGCRGCG